MQHEPYTIRRGRPDDLPELPQIENAAAEPFRDTPYAWLVDAPPVTSEVDLEHELVWVVADAADRPVAFALVHLHTNAVHLHELDVHLQHARQGLGRRLIEAVAEWARARGATALTLTTFDDVPWNGPYYARLGFRVLDVGALSPDMQAVRQSEGEFGLPLEHRLCMQLDL